MSTPVIGIRDSGVGGLTVARCIRQTLPSASLLYFADTAHVPYGDRTPDEVRHFALSISQFLLEQGSQILVFACNTSSAYALQMAKSRFPTPIIGMIEPGARSALKASTGGAIGILATHATVESQVYTHSLQRLRPGARCLEVACPAFVPLVESEQTQSEAAYHAAQHYMEPLLEAAVDTVILGCTHYPLLLPVLREVAPQVCFVDPAEAVAVEVAGLIAERGVAPSAPGNGTPVQRPHDTFYVSGPGEGVRHWIDKLLPHSSGADLDIRPGPVYDPPQVLALNM